MSINITGVIQAALKVLVPVVAYFGSAALGVTGLVLGYQAKTTRMKAETRADKAEPARLNLEQAVSEFNALRVTSYEATVGRFTNWLEQHEKAVEHLDVELPDGETVRVWTAPPPRSKSEGQACTHIGC